MKAGRACELCSGEAALHCASDSAFLCWACDAHVHGANFIVARHARRLLCRECGSLDDDDLPVYGPGFPPLPSLCRSCRGDGDGGEDSFSDSESSSACSSSSLVSCVSSSCVSSAESGAAAACGGVGRGVGIAAVPVCGGGPFKAACSADPATDSECDGSGRGRRRRRRRGRGRVGGNAAARAEVDARTDAVLASWCHRLGLEGRGAAATAAHALSAAARRMGAAPFRVCAAAAVWFAAKLCTAGAPPPLVRLETCSGVPAKLIVVAEARLARAVRRRQRADGEEEGWAECC
ncbi:hypothetical protein Taro_016024 [Colocasia esculenta]|uniref:B box-type domain-containing protein n=1 Tax=Colocasia esculenta TaxID=4460 RepID=A0A843UP11_COLES|nr:hypothetical protein [Colocasia esculenta]